MSNEPMLHGRSVASGATTGGRTRAKKAAHKSSPTTQAREPAPSRSAAQGPYKGKAKKKHGGGVKRPLTPQQKHQQEDDQKAMGARLRAVRIEAGYLLKSEFARHAGVAESTYHAHEAGRRMITATHAERYAAVANVSPELILREGAAQDAGPVRRRRIPVLDRVRGQESPMDTAVTIEKAIDIDLSRAPYSIPIRRPFQITLEVGDALVLGKQIRGAPPEGGWTRVAVELEDGERILARQCLRADGKWLVFDFDGALTTCEKIVAVWPFYAVALKESIES